MFYKAIILIFFLSCNCLAGEIGQLFIVPACPMRGEDHRQDLVKLIREHKIGGIILKQGTVQSQLELIAYLQNFSETPLLCVQDGEWGVGMRLSDAIAFPKNLTLGAVQDLSLLFQLGKEIGRQCLLAGAHLNLAPVADVNCNPQNPIIHMRSFGEDPHQVAIRSHLVMAGMQTMGVMVCAKHFPGHGDTCVDSHADLPAILHDRKRLDSVELLPFRFLIDKGINAVMTAHLFVEALSEEPLLPATFSKKIVTELLQNEYGFDGLVITDALNMKALSKNYSPGQTAIKAFLAGHDLLLYGDHIAPNIDQLLRVDIPQAIDAIKNAVEAGEIPETLIDERVEKILKCKEKLKRVEVKDEEINTPEAFALKRELFREAMTLVRNEGLFPLKGKKLALIEWGSSPFFADQIGSDRLSVNDAELLEKVKNYECLVLALAKLPEDQTILDKLSKLGVPIAAVVFGSPYRLAKLPLYEAVLVAYENEKEAQEAAADVLMGRLVPKGRLPVSMLFADPMGGLFRP
jgi:beta-N-acetylhexosaminidase